MQPLRLHVVSEADEAGVRGKCEGGAVKELVGGSRLGETDLSVEVASNVSRSAAVSHTLVGILRQFTLRSTKHFG